MSIYYRGDILYEKSKHIPDCTNHTPIEKKEKETEISPEIQVDVHHSNNEAQTPPNTNVGSVSVYFMVTFKE